MESDGIYYFNRCRRCNRLITKLQVIKAFKTVGNLCPCGSSMFGPSNLLWQEWVLPRVLKMVVYQLLGKLAPPPSDEPAIPPMPDNVRFASVPPLSAEEVRPPEEGEK